MLMFLAIILKVLPPVCMKYTARGESRVANIARGEAECYIQVVMRPLPRAVYFIQTKQQCFKCFIVFYTYYN